MNKAQIRRLHSAIAPFMIVPVLLTLITGTLFQFAMLMGNAEGFLWLLDLHRGKFGQINLEMVYPFLNALGLLALAITGISMWLRSPR
jgi:hypothetical protein